MSNPYEPSSVDSGHQAVEIPGLEGRVEVTVPGMFSGHKVLVDGAPVPRSWGTYTLPDGRSTKLSQIYTRTVPTLVIDGESYQAGEAVPLPLVALQFAPLMLIGVGGCLGGAAGGAGLVTNMMINRQDWPVPAKAGAMIVVSGFSVVGWLAFAAAFALLLS